MEKILYIESSPRKSRSSSIAISHIFLKEYQKLHPQDELITLDLWQKELPAFDGDTIDAKYAIMHGEKHTDEQKAAWKKIETLIEEFKAADKYVISLPMWNFGIPYILKHYIDLIVQPGYTFKFSPQSGYEGLITGKKIVVIYARGGAYGPGSGAEGYDLQKSYMESFLHFIGFKDIQSIIIEPTMAGKESKEKAIELATNQAKTLATQF
jgi:FMN-dependent NADH-azoreductase